MNAAQAPARSGTPPIILRGRWLTASRVMWVAVASLTVTLFLAGLVPLYEELHGLSGYDGADRGAVRHNLAELGLSVGFYAGYYLVLGLVFSAVCFALAALIFWRRSNELMALFVALLLVLLGATFSGAIEALGDLHPVWDRLGSFLESFMSIGSVFLFFFLFPDGRFVPRWTRWIAFGFFAYVAPSSLFPESPYSLERWPDLAYALFFLAWLLVGVGAQVYRYRRVSGPEQRQQTKWVLFGFSAALVGYLGLILLDAVFPVEPGSPQDLIGAAAAICFMLLIPLSLGGAIMRYHLFDINLIVNRTLVYASLTVMLVGIYLGAVISLQYAFRSLIGQESQLAIVASTLTMAALFSPLRLRVQAFVDRRFYRRKYDAAKTLEAFSLRLRDETDLDALEEDLVSAVHDTVQPEHVSLWLREPERG